MTKQVRKYFPLIPQSEFYSEINNTLNSLKELHKLILDRKDTSNQTIDTYTVPDNILLVGPVKEKILHSTLLHSSDGQDTAIVNYKTNAVSFLGSYFTYGKIFKPKKGIRQSSINISLLKEIVLNNINNSSQKESNAGPVFTTRLNLGLTTQKSPEDSLFNNCIVDLQELEVIVKKPEVLSSIGCNRNLDLSFNSEYWIDKSTADLILGVYQKFLEVSNVLKNYAKDLTNQFTKEGIELNEDTINQLSIYSNYTRDLTIQSEVHYQVPIGAILLANGPDPYNSKLNLIVKKLRDNCIRAIQFLNFLNYDSSEDKVDIIDTLEKCIPNLDYANDFLETVNKSGNSKNIVKISDRLAEVLKPKVQEFLDKLRNTGSQIFFRNTWNYNPPNKIVFESNAEMYEKVMKHCEDIPGFKITYLRKVELLYMSDGDMEHTPHAINHPKYSNKVIEIYENEYGIRDHRIVDRDANIPEDRVLNRPVIYLGEAWLIKFLAFDKDLLKDCRVYFATPEQFYKAYENTRPDLLENFEPFSDLMTITSDWCSRNDPTSTYGVGIDLYSPWSQRQSLKAWILGPAIAKNISCLSFKLRSEDEVKNFNGYYERGKLNVIEKKLNKILSK
jgi:hypothetical protein